MKLEIKMMNRTDVVKVREVSCTPDFIIGDFVIYIPNGLQFRVDNNKTLKWMKQSGYYVKEVAVN